MTTTTYPTADLTEDEARGIAHQGRNAVIAALRKMLKERSGQPWSVTGGTGTAWGWIKVSAPPRRLNGSGMTREDQQALADLRGYSGPSDRLPTVWSIPDSSDYYAAALQEAAGQPVTVHAQPYWD